MHTLVRVISLTIFVSLLGGCYYCPTFKPDVTQGNVIKAEIVDQLRLGMNPEQVYALMGHPVLENTFNQTRLHYVYYFERRGVVLVRKIVILYFDRGRLVKIDRCIPVVTKPNIYPAY